MHETPLRITLQRQEGALLRLLGTVERRGFTVVSIRSDAVDAARWHIHLTVRGSRDVDVLQRQLCRLLDVEQVETLDATPM